MDENKKEKKPFNVVLLGNIESEKAALLHKYIKKRFAIKQLQEMNNREENGEEHSNIDEVMNSVEIHGETVKMKIWDNVSANKLFSSSNKSLRVAQGIILFYSVSNRKSFNMLKLSLSKIIDFDKYDIPMVMVGNDSDTQNREVSYEEAKALADSYGLRFYETSIKSGMGDIFEDIGEQVFYQEYGNKNNSNSNNNSNKNRVLSTSKSTKNFNNNISLYSSEELYQNNFNNKLKERRTRNVSVFNYNREKEKIKADNNKKNINKLLNCDIDLDESITSYKNNNNNIKARNKNKILIKSPDVLINSSILNSSSSLAFSYQGNTEAQKKREQEIKERRLKREKEMKTWWKKREKENLENQKIKKQKEKEELQKRIKVDKINQKEEERKVNEENYIKIKNNYEQKKKNNKDIERNIIIGKENKRKEQLLEKRNNKEKLNKLKEEKEKEKDIKILYNNRNINKNKKNLTYNKSENNIYRNKNDVNNNNNKLRGRNIKKNKNEKNLENSESDILNTSILTTEEQEIIKQNFETKKLLLENYQNNSNIYRCLKCKLIPNIVINEYNQEIETFCDESFIDKSHHNITTYSNFQELSLNHPIDNNNVPCYYCSKVVNELLQGHVLYYCPICDIYFCTEDEELHKNQRHKDEENIKIKYLQLSKNKTKTNNKKETANTSTQNKKNKNLTKQNSTPLLLKKSNNESNLKNKENIKKLKKENKNNDTSSINNSDIILTDKKEKKKYKIFNKIQIYLIDSYCGKHNEIYKSYCFDCHQNICELCENIHIKHNTVKFGEIMLENEELIEKKNELNKAKEDLTKINDCFSALIEAIKCKYERLFSIKKKELEIKEKIIKDYETIKYNYHCINNIRNLKFDNDKNFKDKSNNTDWFHRFNLIFKYLNSNLNNKDNDLFDILNNRNENSNIKVISNNNDINISKLIVLKNDDICVSSKNGNVILYNKDNLEEKLNIKIFGNNLEINDIIERDEGGLLCCGYEYIKNIELSLNNQSYNIIKDSNIYSENKNINSIIELNNDILISSNDNSEIQLWKKINMNQNYKCIDCYNNNIDDEKKDKNYLYKIKNDSFIYSSFKNNNLTFFKINNYDKIQLKKSLENIRIIKGNNPMVKIPNEDYLILSCYDYNDNEDLDINNNEYNNIFVNYKGEFSIIIIDLNNLNIIGNIKNNYPIVDMMYYYDNITIALDAYGEIHKIEFDKYQQKLFLIDKINFKNNIRFDSDKILGFNLTKNRKNIILYLYNKIIIMSNSD